MTITPGYDLATDAQFRELSNFSTPPRAGRVTAIEASGQVRVETDDPDGGDVLAWPLSGFLYAVNDVVYIAFAVNSPDSAIVIGSLGNLPTINTLMLPFVRFDGTTALTGDWIAGALRSILIGTLIGSAASAGNLTLQSSSHGTKGKVLFGASGASGYDEVNNRFGFGVSDPISTLEVVATSTATTRGLTNAQHNAGAQAAVFIFRKSRGSRGTPGVVSGTDFGGTLQAEFYDSASYIRSAGIAFRVNGSVAVGSVPTDIIFATGASNDTSLSNEVMRLLSTGQAGIGIAAPVATILGIKAGSSSNDAAVGGVLYETHVQAGNVLAGEDVLATYTVPASTLSADGMSLWFEAFGTFANNLNAKRIRVQFGTAGTTLVFDLGAGNNFSNQYWSLRGRIVRTGAATQKGTAMLVTGVNGGGPGSAASFVATGLSQTLSGAIVLKVTGEATATNDVVIESYIVGWDDANT